ncbi:ABC transporter ATP-binding protein [Allorhodopirellula solitaria]|uniref:ABC transporter ATP-binding protein YtrB n=1 Tax=Allorhodopirellula solitaria TaxID=2527987 RepID=A0A5C5WYA2_9BACT|nr:ABC transporter ATP-binding protein [Allorhodopirellula solitaria]TWT55666.1 ABC transporter ATP-binding protein YtrB [Allorhodopirellula solitaria]
MSVSHPAIEIDHLSCAFRRSEALHDVTLSIPTGCVFGLVGLNGAGKTTLIRHLIGGLRPRTGRVRVLGEDPTQTPESVMQHVGYVAEEDVLPRWMRVGELIDFMRALYRNWDDQLCDKLLEQFSLDRSTKLADMSKGGRARAGLLVALAHRPQLLILDEPSYGLDPIARQDILEAVVRTASDEGRTVLFSSHLLDEVSRVCDTVGVIGGGRLLEVIATEQLPERYCEVVGELSIDDLAQRELPGFFGWQNRGREWSVAVDRRAYPDEATLRREIGGELVHEVRPLSLERWFSARVNDRELATIPRTPAVEELSA